MENMDFKITKIEKMSLYDAKTNNKTMDFSKYWNNRIYTDEERLELAKELFSDNEYIRGHRAKSLFTYDYNLDIDMEEVEKVLKLFLTKERLKEEEIK